MGKVEGFHKEKDDSTLQLTPCSSNMTAPVVTVEMQGSDDEGDNISVKAKQSGRQSRPVAFEAALEF